MTEDAELLMTLYDGKEHKSITENYVVRWSKDGLMCDLDQMYNLRVMFTVSVILFFFKREFVFSFFFFNSHVFRTWESETWNAKKYI